MKKTKSTSNKTRIVVGLIIVFIIILCAGIFTLYQKNLSSNGTIPAGLDISVKDLQSTVSWKKVSGASGYHVYRAESRFGEYQKITSKAVRKPTYKDEEGAEYYYKITAVIDAEESEQSEAISYDMKLFGSNVYIFDTNDSPEEVKTTVTDIWNQQLKNQFGKERYALLFKPGVYDDSIAVNVGYYTQVAGLGELPTDTEIYDLICDAKWMGDEGNNNATQNFWRGAENLSVQQPTLWAVSQAVSLRRMNLKQDLILHDQGGWASGGYLADSVIGGVTESGSQQQWFSRNTDWEQWEGQVWNMVFVGTEEGKAPEGTWPRAKFTTIETAPVVQEKPFLTYNKEKGYQVFVPELRKDAKGVSWVDGAKGTSISIDDFYIAKADIDTADTINKALEGGKHLILTPGIYELKKPIQVKNEDTIVLGLGLATLISAQGNKCMEIADVDGVKVAGLLFDAGPKMSESLLEVGVAGSSNSHKENPISLSDLYFRVGGITGEVAKSETCIIINSNDVVGDNFWVWRADHGDNVGWDLNTTKNGIIVNGDDVTIYALMVEHFHEYQTVWNGNGGKTYFYQSEIPYDVPDQASWMSHDGTVNGYASYKVADDVTSHEAWGLGIYAFHRDAVIDANSVIEVPAAEGVTINNACSVVLSGNPGIAHIINEFGEAVSNPGERQEIVLFTGGAEVEIAMEVDEGDIAAGKEVFSSSIEEGFPVENVVDGDGGSRWASKWTEDEWIYVDLGEVYTISKIGLDWEAAYASEYKILVSNDANDDGAWKEVAHITKGSGKEEELEFEPTEARFVKMQGIKRKLPYGYSLWSFKVYENE